MKVIRISGMILLLISLFNPSGIMAQGNPAREESKLNQVYSEFSLTGENVVVALIDRGTDYFHPDFIDENGNTRLLYLYDMVNPAGANDPNNPYGIGTIFTEDELNASLASGGDPLSTDRHGHGSATSGITAGNGSAISSMEFQGVAPGARIIVVKGFQDYFPPFGNEPGQDGFFNPSYLPVALEFVADKIEETDLPGVALMNLGSIGGPTDGTSTVCQAMDNFVDQGYTLVCGVGDDGGNDNHASATIAQDDVLELEIQKGEAGNLRLDLWYSEDDRFQVTLVRPDNSTEGPFAAPATANDADDHFLTEINYYHRGANQDFSGATSNRRQLMIDFTGQTGTYKVILEGTTISGPGSFHATLNSSVHYNNNKFLSHIVEGYSLNDYTSAEKVISPTDYVVKNDWYSMDGNYHQMTGQGDPGELWIGSSWGPTHGEEQGVDFAACGEVLYAPYSPNTWYSNFPHLLLQGGENKYGIQNAVSAAAPLTTGVIALMLEMNPNLTAQEIKSILQETASSDSFTGAVPNNQWGYGKLNAFAAMEEVQNTFGIHNNHVKHSGIKISPNPVQDNLHLEIESSIGFKVEKVSLINILGELVYQQEWDKTNSGGIVLNHLPPGIYQLVVSGENGIATEKFLKL